MLFRRVFVLVLTGILSFAGMAELSAQRSPSLWYFGRNAALNFWTGSPAPVLNSAMNTPEGCASYTDNAGLLVFYTNGAILWDSSHSIVPNGTGLAGHPLSTQSVIALPQPKHPTNIYLFTVDAAAGSNGFSYTLLDNSGAVISVDGAQKNVQLLPNTTEKLTSARHCNGRDFWVIVHEWQTDSFKVYLLNEFGIQEPVTSSTGMAHTGPVGNCDGAMKVSPDGDLLATAITEAGVVELFTFNNLSGEIDHLVTLSGYPNAYGVEFSSSGNRLFFSTINGNLYQVDVQDTSAQSILNSVTLIYQSSSLIGSLQLAPNGRIYVAKDIDPFLGVIMQPNSLGPGVNYFDNGIYLGGRRSEAGLPQYIPNAWRPEFTHAGKCLGDTVKFTFADSTRVDSVRWNFGDYAIDSLNTSTEYCPEHYYPYPGYYEVTLLYYHCDTVDSLVSSVEIFSEPNPYLGPDTFLCSNQPLLLDAGVGFLTYLWQNGSIQSSITIQDTGLYWVEVTNVCGMNRDSVYIREVYEAPLLEIMNDTSLCEGDSIWVEADTSGVILTWYDGLHLPGRFISVAGTYFAEVVDTNGCKDSDLWNLNIIADPDISLGNDTTVCIGDMLVLTPGSGFIDYLWNVGSTGNSLMVSAAGTYSVNVSNQCGSDTDSIVVDFEDCSATLYVPNAFTPNYDGLNDVFRAKGEFIAEFEMWIYNRWGELVFKTVDFYEGWDGTFGNSLAPTGAYAWVIKFKTTYGHEGIQTGTVILHR